MLRHGQTVWNTLGRLQGGQDSPLTEYGLQQVDRMGQLLLRELEGAEGVQCQVSPLGRAQSTASRLQTTLPRTKWTTDYRLTEMNFGSWDGMTAYEIAMEYPGLLDGSEAFDWFLRTPDGESFEAVNARLGDWLRTVSGPTVVVTHGVTARVLIGIYLGLPQEKTLRLALPDGGLARLAGGRLTLLS